MHGIRLHAHTIQRVFRDIGVPWLTKPPRRPPRQLELFEKDEPGESVQVDVKVVKLPRETIYQYTALDDCMRLRVLRLDPRFFVTFTGDKSQLRRMAHPSRS